jgi:hypothetical protein
MQPPLQLSTLLGRQCANCGAGQRAIEPECRLGDARRGREAAIVLGRVGAQGADMIEGPGFEPEQVLSLDQLGMLDPRLDLRDDRLVKPRRKHIDHLHAGRELAMFLGRDLAGDEDPEMADRLVQ